MIGQFLRGSQTIFSPFPCRKHISQKSLLKKIQSAKLNIREAILLADLNNLYLFLRL